MRNYFEAEMRLLTEAAQAFAKAHPEQAGKLNLHALQDRDPYIERLLEGFAYLTGQIRQRIDDDLPDISASLLAQLWPQILEPFPAATIMEFTPRVGQLTQSYILPKGTIIQSAPVGDEHTVCQFQTTAPVDLKPLRVIDLQTSESAQGGTLFNLTLQCDQAVNLEALQLKELCFYLHTDPSIALELYWAFTANIRQVKVLTPHSQSLGNQAVVSGCHLDTENALTPLCNRSFHGFHLLQDYFAFREKYLFFVVQDLDKIIWDKKSRQFTLEIHADVILPSEVKLDARSFLLHCAPAVNLSKQTSEPIRLTYERFEYPVIADVGRTQSMVVHQVNHVTSVDLTSGERSQYSLLHSFKHKKTTGQFYQVLFRDFGGELAAPHLVLAQGKQEQDFRPKDISCELTVSNGHYPRRYLREGMINQLIGVPNYVAAKNITRPTAFLLPPKRSEYLWQLISQLSLNYQSIASADALQQLLQLFQWTERSEHVRRIEAIRDVRLEAVDKVERGALLRGMKLTLLIHEDGFRSIADIYLFGTILQQFFSMYAALNCFVETIITCHPSQRILLWRPQCGQKSPL